jgi:diaminopimelate epimerase
MRFYKAHGLGNDFIIFPKKIELTKEEIIKLCRIHYGVGADGVVILNRLNNNEYEMEIYNQDGSKALTCGNALRCVGKLINHLEGVNKITVKTSSDINEIEVTNKGVITYFRLPSYLEPKSITINDLEFHLCEIGNYHAIARSSNLSSFNFEPYAKVLQKNYPYNIEAYQVISPSIIKARFYEYGVFETNSCTSGSVALFYHLVNEKIIDKSCTIVSMGGSLNLALIDDKIKVEGDARIIFKGELIDGEL